MFRRIVIALALAAGLASSGSAAAKVRPVYAKPAAWVDLAPVPQAEPGKDAGAVQTLLDDNQSRLGPDGDAYYNRRIWKVLKTEGLARFTNLSQSWNPDNETVTFHWIRVIRDGKTIDLLQGGRRMLVIRRERDLERAMLDGRMTASLALEGLQVGDVLDYAWTRAERDPILQGRSYDLEAISFSGVAARYRVILNWPQGAPIQWKATPGFGEPTLEARDGRTWLRLDLANAEQPKRPMGAPARFRRLGMLETSGFRSWAEVSQLMHPLYERTVALDPKSPLKAEAAAIAAASTDPRARAFAALRLVQDKTRYLFIGMDNGGYVPAAADLTWTRKFGDCKGKTVLLLALLEELGIEAEPALVNLGGGDGLDQRPPSLGAFNHVIVRATIGGKVYWLDGTGSDHRVDLEALEPPPHRWALPVRAAGADLEQILVPPLKEPMMHATVQVDASKSLDQPAPMKLTLRVRGAAAGSMRQMLAASSRADLERSFRQSMSNSATGLTVENMTWKDDLTNDAFEMQMTGSMELDWRANADLGVREYRVSVNGPPGGGFPRREPGLHQDAPFRVAYPLFITSVTEVVLPKGGEGFVVRGPNGVDMVGGMELKRSSALKDGVARFEVQARAIAEEIPASEAEAANRTMRRLSGEDSLIRAPL